MSVPDLSASIGSSRSHVDLSTSIGNKSADTADAADEGPSVAELFEAFRGRLAGVVEEGLQSIPTDSEWMRSTISTNLTVNLQREVDSMAIATVDELRNKLKRNTEAHTTKLE